MAGVARYRQISVPVDHPLATSGMPVSSTGTVQVWEHRLVLYEKVGPGPHPCTWCGGMLEWLPVVDGVRKGRIVADHLNEDVRDNRPENLVVSCQGCNVGRNHPHRIPAGELTMMKGSQLTRAVERTCEECGAIFLMPASRQKANPKAGRYCTTRCTGLARRTKG